MIIQSDNNVPAQPVQVEGAHGVEIRLLVHQAQGASNFYMRQFLLAAGGHTPRHSHAWEHEVYILAGEGEAWTGVEYRKIGPGDAVFVAPNEEHQFRNVGSGQLKFLCMIPSCGK